MNGNDGPPTVPPLYTMSLGDGGGGVDKVCQPFKLDAWLLDGWVALSISVDVVSAWRCLSA